MNADRYAELLSALQKLETALARDGVQRMRGELRDWAKARHAEAETGGRLDAFAKVVAGRSAVQLLLRTVYVRVLEDLGLLDPPRVRGQRGAHLFSALAPALGYRGFFRWTFRDLAVDFPDLFAERPDELPLPGEALCKQIWDLWHAEDGKGNLLYAWQGDTFDSRFLGDLYQDLDADVRKRYALLQTPEFVERYILDHTLTPALAAFDPAALEARDETFRLIDPTCGSGHFLIGGFHRLADYWQARGADPWTAARKALDGIWGCDLNPHAVHIARFRLLLEVITRTGERDLARLATLPMHLRAMDSLIPWEGVRGQMELLPGPAAARLEKYGTARDRADNAAFLGRDFHVVVGNPPYVTPKDPKKRDDYRVFWPESASGKYGLMAPFAERIFRLGCQGAFTGQITSNSFCKRQFGRGLIERVLPSLDLSDIIDTSGAYIPGHGTPTVILFGRSQLPSRDTIRCVFGKQGEPTKPEEPSRGKVWTAIRDAGRTPDDDDPFVTVSSFPRSLFGGHPWNLSGGGAPELMRRMERALPPLESSVLQIGVGAVTALDPVYTGRHADFRRSDVPEPNIWGFGIGEDIRDFEQAASYCLFPYDPETFEAGGASLDAITRFLWHWRVTLQRRVFFGKTQVQRGLTWFEYAFLGRDKVRSILSLSFAFVSTHNHFVLDEGGKVFNRTAPVIKLPDAATRDDHLDLLGLLNSSTLGFWMKQVFFDKGNGGIGGGIAAEEWERFFEFDATKLKQAPITEADRAPRIDLARALHDTARARAATLPAAILAGDDWTAATLAERLRAGADAYRARTAEMVALQEELDWLTYRSYGLLDGHTVRTPAEIEPLRPGHRPFEIVLARHNATCAPEERSAWFTRHGHAETTSIPDDYRDATRALIAERLEHIAQHKDIRLVEQPQFKRRWQLVDYAEATRDAAADWLLDRLEDLFHPGDETQPPGPLSEPRPHRLEDIVNAWRRDPRVEAVAAAHVGRPHPDLTALAEQLLRREAIPDNIFRVYSDEGLRKLRQWQEVWRLQDREDAGEDVGEIPLPPKYAAGDFADPRYYQIRGKLDVPRERFVLYADLRPHRFGWNGWRDTQRAVAQVEAFAEAESHPTDPLPRPTAADPRRCGATIGLWETLPDVRRWGDAAAYTELHAFAAEGCQQTSCPCAVAEAWREWAAGDREVARGEGAAPEEVTVEERAAVIALFHRLCPPIGQIKMGFARDELPLAETAAKPLSRAQLERAWTGSPTRLGLILDDLVASGDVATTGRGQRTRYRFDG